MFSPRPVLLTLAVSAGACGAVRSVATNSADPAFDGFAGDARLGALLDFRNIRSKWNSNGRFELEGTFIKKTQSDLSFLYKMEWYNSAGFRLDDPTQSFEILNLSGLRGQAVGKTAVPAGISRWRIRVAPAEESAETANHSETNK